MKNALMWLLFTVIAVTLFIGCDNGTTSTVEEPTTLDKIYSSDPVVFPTFSEPSANIADRAADLDSVDNQNDVDGSADTSEAYNYIENINDTIMVVLTNNFLDAIKNKIDQGEDFTAPTFVEFMNGDMEIDCTLKVEETEDRVVFYGYVDRSWPSEDGTVSSITDSPAEMSFASDFSDIIMQVAEEDPTGDLYEKVAYDYETKSGFFGSFKDETNPIFKIEQIIKEQDNSITFKMLSNNTSAESPYHDDGTTIDHTNYDVLMYSLYQEGIKYYNENGNSPLETYYLYDGTVDADGASLATGIKSDLDAKIDTLINNTNSSTAKTIYESIPSADLSSDKYDAIKAAHDERFL